MRACSYSCVFAFIAVLMRLQDLVGNAWYTRSLPLLGFWLILLIPQWYMVALTLNYFDQRLYLRKKSHNQRALSAP